MKKSLFVCNLLLSLATLTATGAMSSMKVKNLFLIKGTTLLQPYLHSDNNVLIGAGQMGCC
ncbi:hypothetical protein [Paenibacillus polymyxa]|uniref:hypothetical protein n=1 Tax=Paenibacillus TaxID=44249 RepID=UPI0027906CBE|nr:hypothetical protein [Paenibacillus polymyxa]MDQ0045787.1 hypothetical protein [Paenibacillus polymyxa]